jgi:hypothetical protein
MSHRRPIFQKAGPLSAAERKRSFERQKEWLEWLETELRTENGQRMAREVDVSAHSAHALAVVISKSGPSFSQEGIYASQEWLAGKLANQLHRDNADVRLVRRATKLLVNLGALRVEAQSGKTNLLVPLLAGDRLYAVETGKEGGTAASATPDASIRSTPDATVPRPRTPASDKSSYKNTQRGKDIDKLPPYPPEGEGGGVEPTVVELRCREEVATNAMSEEGSGPNGSEDCGRYAISSAELEAGPILVGEVLPPEGASSFERFWNSCKEPRGSLVFALSEWNKLSFDEQRRACERPSNGSYVGNWLRQRAFDLPPTIVERPNERIGFAAIAAMSDEEWDEYSNRWSR